MIGAGNDKEREPGNDNKQREQGRRTMTIHQNFIAGEWVKADAAGPNINPSDLKDVIGEYARATRADAEAAIAAAKAASYGFARSNPQARYDALMMISNEIIARK